MKKDTLVIVGASLAGGSAAVQLRKDGFDGRIVLVGEEPEAPYERPELSKGYLRGTKERGKLDVREAEFYGENSIELLTSTRVTTIDAKARDVLLSDGQRIRFDQLLLATGSSPRRLKLSGSDLAGIHYLRTVSDSDAIREATAGAHKAVVIGGGWIGAEVAASLRELGLEVTMVLPEPAPLERVLGPEVGAVYRDLHREHGVELRPGQRLSAFLGRRSIEAVQTDDGTRIPCDFVVVGAGASPRIELAAQAGLDVARGVLVDARLETSVPGIYAAGDVAEAWNPTFETRIRVEHWDNARRQGRAAARNMLGIGEPYDRIPYFYSDQYDLGMEYSGYAPSWDRVVFRGDPASRQFIAFWLRDGRVVAGMNANIWEVNDALAGLVRSGPEVSVERLTDESVPLEDLDALRAEPPLGSPSSRRKGAGTPPTERPRP
jgi:3-phenylpropionate/trans-cinnamate dioxygenase ferredoxin reductase subunit